MTAIKILDSDIENGLSEKEVQKRQLSFGKNIISKDKKNEKITILLNQIKNPLIYILIFAAIITLFLAKYTDAIVIILAVVINTIFGFVEELKVSKVLEKLQTTIKTKAIVLRDGKKREVLQEELVPGDIIILKSGEKIPADARLLSVNNLKISESILTGEWLVEEKEIKIIAKETPLADRKNMVYMGSLIENGSGKALITETGKNTETGKIASLLHKTEETKTPLQEKLISFSKYIGIAIGVICILIFLLGIFLRNQDVFEMFETAIAVAVGGIPESLPIVMTIILAIGTERILKKRGLIRKLSSVETLGSTQIICFDKTRTLTEGKMKLNTIIAKNGDLAFKIAILCNDAFIEGDKKEWKINGSPTSKAVLEGAIRARIDIDGVRGESEELENMPFNSTNKYILSLRKEKTGKKYLYIAGAPEKIIEMASNNKNWEKEIERLTEKGLRVIAVGQKEVKKSSKDLNKISHDFTIVGLLSFIDPLRKDVKKAIKKCMDAGIKPILATGDHVLTAKNIAEQIGLKVKMEEIMDGYSLDQLNDNELKEKINKIKIFARVEPKHKLRIVEAWQQKGKVIAMTGDGVNDAPAIKKADIGIALGSGTEVAKEASDLILMDDNFSTIVNTIEEGRTVLDNLRKSISYALADSFTSVILVGFSTIVFGWPLPILAVQILWNNFVEDIFPTISFAFEPKEKNTMKRAPSKRNAPLLTREMKVLIFATGLIDEFLILFFFWFLYFKQGMDLEYVRTVIFGMICVDTAFVIFAYKNLRKNLWQIKAFSNQWLNLSVLFVFVSCLFAIYFPPFQVLLKTVALDFYGWALIVLVGFLSLALIEITKHYFIVRKNTEN